MKPIVEVRKEDDIYYQGAFWVVGESVHDIKTGNFKIEGIQIPCDCSGNYLKLVKSKSGLTHKNLWNREFKNKLNSEEPFNYYPRGRVSIHKGIAYINLYSLFNQPDIIDQVTNLYHLENLEIEIDLKDTYQGSHYDFLLE